MHEFELRWGRVHKLEVHCDTAKLESYCHSMAAAPISDAIQMA
ncbi:hypothetical protein [Duganella vulcania]|nr:hypothetical protein [Duganella vulcania]